MKTTEWIFVKLGGGVGQRPRRKPWSSERSCCGRSARSLRSSFSSYIADILLPTEATIKTLLSCLADQITRKHSQKALMCNMVKNHVHHSIKFRLDLNGTLPLLTLGSTSPDKLICSGPCQMPSQPPPAHWENTVTLCLVPSDYILYLVPPHSSWPRPHKVMTHPPMFHFISSELQTLWH